MKWARYSVGLFGWGLLWAMLSTEVLGFALWGGEYFVGLIGGDMILFALLWPRDEPE